MLIHIKSFKMTPQIGFKRNFAFPFLFFTVLIQAQTNIPVVGQLTSKIKGIELPNVTGSAGLNNTTNEIDMTGEIIDTKESAVIEMGFVYSTSVELPTISDTKITVEMGNETFSNALGNLLNNTIYYVRPYATSVNGTSYGNLSTIDTSTLSNIKIDLKARIKTYPNPSTSYISLSGLMETKNYIIYNMTGKELMRGSISYNNKIDVRFLNNGLYLLKLEDFEIIKFIKE